MLLAYQALGFGCGRLRRPMPASFLSRQILRFSATLGKLDHFGFREEYGYQSHRRFRFPANQRTAAAILVREPRISVPRPPLLPRRRWFAVRLGAFQMR